jgi:hypothetical protein
LKTEHQIPFPSISGEIAAVPHPSLVSLSLSVRPQPRLSSNPT